MNDQEIIDHMIKFIEETERDIQAEMMGQKKLGAKKKPGELKKKAVDNIIKELRKARGVDQKAGEMKNEN